MQIWTRLALAAVLASSGTLEAQASESKAATIATGPIVAPVPVESFALVDRAPVRNGYGLFSIEATNLLPAPRKRESFTPTEDEHYYNLRRTVDRFLQRKEIPRGWSKSNEGTFSFKNELDRFRAIDGIAYAIEGELVVRGTSPIPAGVTLAAPAPPEGVVLRYSLGMMVADQPLLMKEGILDGTTRKVGWMLSLRPSGADAAIPVRAVFAVRAEGGDEATQRATLAGITATLNSSSDGRAAMAERNNDAAEWLKPMQTFIRPDQVAGKGGGGGHGGKEEKGKEEKKEKKGGH